MCNAPGLGGGTQQSSGAQYGPLGGGGAATVTRNTLADLLVDQGIGGPTGQYSNLFGGSGGVLGAFARRTQTPPTYTPPEIFGPVKSGVQQAFESALSQGFGKYSAQLSRAGMNRPENFAAVLGGAVQNTAPQFANLYANAAAEQERARAQAPLIQEDINRQRFNDLLQALGLAGNQIGGTGTQVSYGVTNSDWAKYPIAAGAAGIAAGAI